MTPAQFDRLNFIQRQLSMRPFNDELLLDFTEQEIKGAEKEIDSICEKGNGVLAFKIIGEWKNSGLKGVVEFYKQELSK